MNKSGGFSLDEIREISRIGYAPGVSIVDKLIEAGWCAPEDLERAHAAINRPETDSVAVLFQLPFVVRLPEKWISIPAKKSHPQAYFRTVGTQQNRLTGGELSIGERGSFAEVETMRNAKLAIDSAGTLLRTQAIVTFHLWDRYQRVYSRYLDAVQDERSFSTTVIHPDKRVLSSRPMTSQSYESYLAKLLWEHSISVLGDFFPLYAVACRDPFAFSPKDLANYFVVTKAGRTVANRSARSLLAIAALTYSPRNWATHLGMLNRLLESARPPSVYEQYLLEAVRQIELGSTSLAIVQTVMILEWFANQLIDGHLVKEVRNSLQGKPALAGLVLPRIFTNKKERRHISVEQRFKVYLPALGINLEESLLGKLGTLVKLRNDIVHHDQPNEVKVVEAEKAVNLGMTVIRECMDQLFRNQDARLGRSKSASASSSQTS